jgi:histidinol-phosphatase
MERKPTSDDDLTLALQVATGGYDVAIFLIAGPWDLAAPLLVVEEAGGRFSDIDGRYDWTTGSAVFSNGHLHDDVIRIAALT